MEETGAVMVMEKDLGLRCHEYEHSSHCLWLTSVVAWEMPLNHSEALVFWVVK